MSATRDATDYERLIEAAKDDELPAIEEASRRAGIIWDCRHGQGPDSPEVWTVHAGDSCRICGRTELAEGDSL